MGNGFRDKAARCKAVRALRRCAIRCAVGSSQEVPVRDVATRVMGAYRARRQVSNGGVELKFDT